MEDTTPLQSAETDAGVGVQRPSRIAKARESARKMWMRGHLPEYNDEEQTWVYRTPVSKLGGVLLICVFVTFVSAVIWSITEKGKRTAAICKESWKNIAIGFGVIAACLVVATVVANRASPSKLERYEYAKERDLSIPYGAFHLHDDDDDIM
jgi:hypothetical protein